MKGWVIMKKALKKIAVMVTIVALTMGNSVLSAAESGLSTQFEVSDPNEVYRWIYNNLSHISLNDAYVSTSDSKINLTDISGKTFDLKTKGGSVVFYNDSEVSKASGLVLTFDGSQTMQDIDENIKRG